MKNHFLVAVSFIAVALGVASPARAARATTPNESLDFGLSTPTSNTVGSPTETVDEAQLPGINPLEAPSHAKRIPIGAADQSKALTELPPPPPTVSALVVPVESTLEEAPSSLTSAPPPAVAVEPAIAPAPSTSSRSQVVNNDGILSFEPAAVTTANLPKPQVDPQPLPPSQAASHTDWEALATLPNDLKPLFHGGTGSLVARAVGSAEGTRTPDGGKTWAFRGHVDPGNGVWNLGTFSYQHGARSPEEADLKQLRRLMGQAQTLQQQAVNKGLTLSLEETLNGIDLANQSPRAALSRGGYIDRLRQAYDMGLQGSEAVLWARTRAYLDPDTSRWNAPGLGNNVYSITADQQRRQDAIARAISVTPQLTAVVTQGTVESTQTNQSASESAIANSPSEPSFIDQLMSFNLPGF